MNRSPAFKQRLLAALEAARAAGVARVKITDGGRVFDFDLQSASTDNLNDFDTLPPKAAPKPKEPKS
jgi:hypothetical protein